MGADLALSPLQFIILAFGLCALLLVEWMLETRLITTANGTYFATNDGKMAEAVVRTAYRFAEWFNVTNLNPLQGVGSQLLPLNVWANPVHWPLAFFDGKLATDIAGLVVLICIAGSCYVMARCFDLPPLPSVIAAQLASPLTLSCCQDWQPSTLPTCWRSDCSRVSSRVACATSF